MAISFSLNGRTLAAHRVFCIGRNYAEHVRELAHAMPAEPAVFMKPVPSLVPAGETVHVPPYGKQLQHEAEAVVLIGGEGRNIKEAQAGSHIAGISLGLDLTLRDVQNELKDQGLPWELSKAFEQSAPIGSFLPYDGSVDLENFSFVCSVNGAVRQRGNTKDMIFPVKTLVSFLSRRWTLQPGDLIFTGTPSGVGPLAPGDRAVVENERTGAFSWDIAGTRP